MSFDLFENIEFKNLKNLYYICKKNHEFLDRVKLEYSRNNLYLQETFNLLIDIGLIKIKDNSLEFIDISDEKFDEELFLKISDHPEYGLIIKEYISNFIGDENNTFKPDAIYNNITSDLRNFLISSKKIDYKDDKYYLIDKKILDQSKHKEFSPEQLKKVLENRNKIGLDAEKLVAKYEAEKIKEFNNDLKIDHIALRDVSAGYDIKSYEKINQSINEIYIEVKAVSKSNYKFHLSIQENQTANKLKDKFYLYLLPVDYTNSEKFDYSKLLKINNVHKSIFGNKNDWAVDNDGFVISKIS